ncbi:MAG TPA: hypothetical protein PLU49_12930, partial [Saprospiraceae bacterium]|nr:hypothetical protein [Saprospiraceae bacterium]
MNNDNFDKLAKQALSEEEYNMLTQIEEQDLYSKLNRLINRKSNWIIVYIFIVTLIIFIAFIFFSINLFGSNDVKEMIIGLYLTGFSLIMILGIKMYVWMQLNQKALLRELKKIELEL